MANNWYGPPPWYGYGGMMQPTNDGYIQFLKKELKEAKKKDKEKGEKKEEKKIWWKKAEVTVALFFLSPFVALIYLSSLKLAWVLLKTFMN